MQEFVAWDICNTTRPLMTSHASTLATVLLEHTTIVKQPRSYLALTCMGISPCLRPFPPPPAYKPLYKPFALGGVRIDAPLPFLSRKDVILWQNGSNTIKKANLNGWLFRISVKSRANRRVCIFYNQRDSLLGQGCIVDVDRDHLVGGNALTCGNDHCELRSCNTRGSNARGIGCTYQSRVRPGSTSNQVIHRNCCCCTFIHSLTHRRYLQQIGVHRNRNSY